MKDKRLPTPAGHPRMPTHNQISYQWVWKQDNYNPHQHRAIADRLTTPKRRKLFCLER